MSSTDPADAPAGRPSVVQVVGTFDAGGAQRQACNLVEGLAIRGIDSWGLALRSLGSFAETSQHSERFFSTALTSRRVGKLVSGAFRLRRFIRDKRIDVIHVHGSTGLPLVIASVLGMRRRPRVVFVWQDSGAARADARLPSSTRWAIRRCDALLASSHFVAEWLERVSGAPYVETFHGGVPVRPAAAASTSRQVIWMGRWVADKDPELVVRAVAALKRRGISCTVTMLGPVPRHGADYRQLVESRIREEGLGDCIRMPGYLSDDDLNAIMRDAAISVQSSRTEGLSMALLEQMMSGLAIVATDVGDTRIALQDGRCGLLFESGHADQLASHMQRLLERPDERAALGAAARLHAERVYSIDSMAERAERIYRDVVEGVVPDRPR